MIGFVTDRFPMKFLSAAAIISIVQRVWKVMVMVVVVVAPDMVSAAF